MKATFLRVSEGGKIAVSGEVMPDKFEIDLNKKQPSSIVKKFDEMKVFNDSFVEVSNDNVIIDELLTNDELMYAEMVRHDNKGEPQWVDGLYPAFEGLEFEVTCKWKGNRDACGNETCWDLGSCQKSPAVAIVSLVEPSKEGEKENLYESECVCITQCRNIINAKCKHLPQDMERLGEKTEWISAENKLPEKSGNYLVLVNGKINICWISPDGYFELVAQCKPVDNIDFWMPLPSPPTKD